MYAIQGRQVVGSPFPELQKSPWQAHENRVPQYRQAPRERKCPRQTVRVRIGPYMDACRKALGKAMYLMKGMAAPAAQARLQMCTARQGAVTNAHAPCQCECSAQARILR